jgi:tRNA nucleotidyltransferase (CCA-adding enzyme)
MRCDVLRRPERFAQMLDACEADKCSRPGMGGHFRPRDDAMAALRAMQSVDAGAVAQSLVQQKKPEQIADAVREARIEAIRQLRPQV